MRTRELSISGAMEITPEIHADHRGAFLEWFVADRVTDATGRQFPLAQANCSVSVAGAVRGIHFSELPPGQAKYVTCLHGAVFDVVVDVRVGSPTYGGWDAVTLDDADRRAVYLSEGLGHAFMALSDEAVVAYLCSAPYAPGREHGVHPFDAALGIEWPTAGRDGTPLVSLLSTKDDGAPSLEQARAAGLLPGYQETLDFLAGPGR
jgi:dTDP-4-dehydrorhamnose 3,5-epimerase